MKKKPLVILTGPTAVGKSALSISLAKAIDGEIISADSMQVYKYMDIGTDKITPEQMEGVPHYLIDEFEPDKEFNVVTFQKYAKKYISEIYEKNKIPILVGGTGFYIQAVLYDIDFKEAEDDYAYRNKLEKLAKEKGRDYIHKQLEKIDPESAKAIHPNNLQRVIRALEYYKETGELMSDHNKKQKEKTSPYNFCYFVLNKDREKLYNSINLRVDEMFEEGLVDEVKSLLDRGYTKDLVSMQGLGYKEIIPYILGERTLEEAIYLLKRDTRHYAKRQLTWFRREENINWINKEDYTNDKNILSHMKELLFDKGLLT